MAICSHLAPNGEKSILYQQLEQEFGPDRAHDYWEAIRTEQFLVGTKDWMDDIDDEFNQHLDANGEPSSSWVKDQLGIKSAPKILKGQMTFEYGSNRRPEISAETTLQAIRMGERTATTRYDSDGHLDYWKSANVGDTIEFTGKNGEKVNVEVTKALQSIKDIGAEEWSKKEGWSIDYFNKKVLPKLNEAYQLEYKYIPKAIDKSLPIIKKNFEPDGKDRKGVTNRESEEVVFGKIKQVYQEALTNPDKQYHIDYEIKSDNYRYASGYTAKELAQLLDTGEIPSNIRFTNGMQKLINNSSKRILESLGEQKPSELINRNEGFVNIEAAKILISKRDAEGKLEGYFTSAEQQDIIDSIMYVSHQFLLKEPNLQSNAIIKTFKSIQAKAAQLPDSQFRYIHDQRIRVADELLNQMSNLGYSIDVKGREKILRAVEGLEYQKEIDNKNITETKPEYDLVEHDIDSQEFMEALGHGLKDWGEVSFEHDPKDTASGRMKMFIANIPDMDRGVYRVAKDGTSLVKPTGNIEKYYEENPGELKKIAEQVNRKGLWMEDKATSDKLKTLLDGNHSIILKRNFLGIPKLVDFESTYQDILENLADSPTHDFDTYMASLSASGRPNLVNLVSELNKQDQQVKNEFARLVSMQYTQQMMMLFNRTSDGETDTYKLIPFISNRYSQLNTIVKNWQQNQKLSEIMKINESGQRVIDVDRAKNKWIPALKTLSKVDWSVDDEGKKNDAVSQKKARSFVQDMLRISGIHLDDHMVAYMFKNMERLTKGTSLAGGIAKQFSVTETGEPNGMFSAFIMKMAGVSDNLDIDNRNDNKVDLESRAELHNPLYTENTTMKILSNVAAKFTPVLHSGSSKNAEGKDIWNYTMHNKLSHMMIDMKDNFDDFASRYSDTDISKNNHLLKILANYPAYRERINLMYMDGMKPTWGNRGTMRTDMSDREQLLMSVGLFQNQGLRFEKIPQVHFMSLTHSDKTTTPLFMNMPALNMGTDSIPRDIIGRIGSAFYNVFKGEYDRIIKQSTTDFNDNRYNKGKNLFYFMPEFNHESMKQMVKDGFLSEKEFQSIWTGGEKNLTKSITNDIELTVINKILNKVAQDRIQNTLDAWTKNGLVTENVNLFEEKYTSKLLKTYGINTKESYTQGGSKIKTYTRNGKELIKKEINDIAVHGAAKDYSLNYFLHNVGLSQLFYGDPALTFKSGKSDMESVDLTMKEYGKRLAKDIAPGLDPYFRSEDKQYNSITLADHIQSEKYLSNLVNIFPSYGKVNATDAQEFTTVAEHLIVKYANGEISSKIFNDMMNVVKSGKYYEFTDPDHLQVIMQPQKPVYAGQRPSYKGAILEDYIKTSSIPLYPPATAGLEIDGLRTEMEKRIISRAAFESGKKEGSPNKPAQFFSADGTFTMPKEEEINGAMQKLDRSGFRIQQEVPYDEEKEAIKTVSQMNKLIVEGIDDIEGFKINGQDLKGSQVRQLKEQIRKDMLKIQYDQFIKDWNIDSRGRIQDKSVVYDKLAQLATTKNFTMNELQGLLGRDEKGNLWIPLQYNSGADKYESMLMSMVKDISQIKMPGKSFVQASSVGLKFSEGRPTKGKAVYVGDYNGEPLKTTRIEDGVVKPAQVMIPFNFTDSNGRVRDIKDFLTPDSKLDTQKVPDSLRQLIGARIPNQGHSSMAAMEVVGFIPKEMGDTVFVPAGFTTQMGADFDVDKLYTYRRPYSHDKDSDGFSVKNPPNSMSKLQNDYFDVHHAVLTHPEMAEKVLRPLDKKDLKDENSLLAPKNIEGNNFFDHMNQLQDFQNGKDAKMLVALTSLAVTFNSMIQNKNLHFAKDDLTSDENGMPESVQVRDHIVVKDEHTGKELKLTNLSGNGKSNYTKEDGGERTKDSIRSKSDNQSTIQSAAVDNAKDRALDNLNITPHTYPAIRALMDLETEEGEAVNLKYGTRLLTQPIIKEFAAEMKKVNDSLSESYDPNFKENIFANLRKKYVKDFGREDFEEAGHTDDDYAAENTSATKNIIFDPQLLKKAPTMDPESLGYAAHQLAALNLFQQLDTIGKRESELQSYFNQDTQGAGPNLLTALDKQDKMDRLDQSPIANGGEIGYHNEKRTEAGYTADVTTGSATKFLSQLLPYDKYIPIFKELASHAGKQRMSIEDQRDVLRAIRSHTYTAGEHWWSDPTKERGRLLYSEGDRLSLARRTEEAKRTWGKDNYFLQRLDPIIGDTTTSPDYIQYQAATTGRIDEQNNNRSWLELLMSKNEEQRRLGEDLLRYTYLTGGVQDANSFVKFVPNSYISNTDFGNMLKEKAERYDGPFTEDNNPTLDMPGFVQQYLQHNPKKAFVINRESFGDIPSEQNYPESFKLDDNQKVLFKEDGEPRDFVSYRSPTENKWILYNIQHMDNGNSFYVRIDTLGNKFMDEYNGEAQAGITRSIFTENRSMAENLPGISPNAQYANNAQRELGKFYEGATHYEKLNIREGSGFGEALRTIADDKDVPERLRSVAKLFSMITESPQERKARRIIAGYFEPKIVFNKDLESYIGRSFWNGTIELKPQAPKSKEEAADTFLHEMSHHKLQSTILLAGYDDRAFSTLSDNVKSIMKEFQEKNPKIMRHLRELDRIRFDAYSRLKSELGDKFVTTDSRVYAFSSMQEFVAGVMSDKSTQDYLNNVPSVEGTFLQRIWRKLKDTVMSMLDNFKWVNKESALEEALYHTISLTGGSVKDSKNITNALVDGSIMRVELENEANDLKQLGEDTYHRPVTIDMDEMGHTIFYGKLDTNKKSNSIPGGVGNVIDKLKKQMDKAYNDTSKGTEEDRIHARIRYNDLRRDYNDALREHSPSMIGFIANKQLDWVDKVLGSGTHNAATIQAALDAANLWGNIIDSMYNKLNVVNIDPTLKGLQDRASEARIRLINTKARSIAIDTVGNKVQLIHTDFDKDLIDPNLAESKFLTLARLKPKLLSSMGAVMKEGVDNRDEHAQRVMDRLSNIADRMKKANVKVSDFMQRDNWGLKDRVTTNYYEHIKDIETTRDDKLNSAYRTEGLTNEQREKIKQDAYQDYFNAIKKSSVIVDSRSFFDLKTGVHKNDEGYNKAFDKLTEDVGSKDYAKQLVDQAHEKYQKYLDERQIRINDIQANTMLTDAERKDKTSKEQDDLLKSKQEAQLNHWLLTDSPDHFLNKINGKGDLKYLNNGDRYLVMAPKGDQGSFYDQEYDGLMNNTKLAPIFKDYKDLIQEMTSYLPPEHRDSLPPGFLPIMSNETINSIASMIGKLRNFDATLMEKLTATEGQEWSKIKPDEIPILFTRETSKTKDEAERSTDLINVAKAFSLMALHYKYMSPILDQINVMESIVKEANRQRVSENDEGPVLRNALDVIAYNKDRSIFNKSHPLEFKIDSKRYGLLNQVKQIKIQNDIKKLTEEKATIEKEIISKQDEGEFDTDKEEKRIEKINEKLNEYDKNAKYIYGSKAIDVLMSINQLKAVAYNPFSVVPVFCFNSISAMNYATGRTNYDPSHLRQARAITMHALKNYYTFGVGADSTSKKIRSLMERSQVMTSLSNMDHQMSSGKSHLKEAINPFNWHQASDYYNKSTVMVAMMLKKEVEAEDVNTGEKIKMPLFNALDEEGKWDTNKYMENTSWYSNDINQQKEWNKFRDQMRGVANIVFGNQDKNSPLLAKKSSLLRLVGQFRISWFPEGLNTRFGSERYDPLLQRDVKGRYRSFGTLGIATSFFIMARSVLDSMPGIHVDRFKGLTDKEGNGIKDIDMENMRRNFAGMAWTVGITASMLMLKSFIGTNQGKKKDVDQEALQMVLNSLIRNQQDLMMYSSPGVWDTVTGDIVPATSVINDGIRAMKATGHYFFGDTHKDKHAFDTWLLHLTKATPILDNINKAKYMMTRDLDDIQK